MKTQVDIGLKKWNQVNREKTHSASVKRRWIPKPFKTLILFCWKTCLNTNVLTLEIEESSALNEKTWLSGPKPSPLLAWRFIVKTSKGCCRNNYKSSRFMQDRYHEMMPNFNHKMENLISWTVFSCTILLTIQRICKIKNAQLDNVKWFDWFNQLNKNFLGFVTWKIIKLDDQGSLKKIIKPYLLNSIKSTAEIWRLGLIWKDLF